MRRYAMTAVVALALVLMAAWQQPASAQGKCAKCNLPASQGGCKCDSNCDCIGGGGGGQDKCFKCNVPTSQGGCKCNGNCDCVGTTGSLWASRARCAKCNLPASQGGCKCNNNCDCV